jgi:rhodanese-related sulfurtransferase
MIKQLTLGQLQARRAANPALALLEALLEKYYQEGHLPQALHMPHDKTRQLAGLLVPDLSTEVIVYCASATCQNSHIAARLLEQIGYTNVAVFGGGKQAWVEAGLALEPGVEQAAA